MNYNPFLTSMEMELLRTKEALRQQQARIQESSRAITQRFVPEPFTPKPYEFTED
jgi:hypothetical protein